MGGFLKVFSSFFAVALALPTFLVLMTWNALPGQNLYPLKRGLEEVPRLAFGKTKVAADYEVALADRRFIEATTLVKTNDTAGLVELKKSISQASVSVTETKNETAKDKLIDNLIVYQKTLEEEKKTVVLAVALPPTKPDIVPPAPVSENTQQVPTPKAPPVSLTVPPKPQIDAVLPPKRTTVKDEVPVLKLTEKKRETIGAIEETQKEIEKTIKELKKNEKKENKGRSTTGGRVFPNGKVPESQGEIKTDNSNHKR